MGDILSADSHGFLMWRGAAAKVAWVVTLISPCVSLRSYTAIHLVSLRDLRLWS
jgi:hypothetical protein